MERLRVNRTNNFKWNTRQELYDYFLAHFGLNKERVDSEISDVLEIFSLRKGESIKPQELWQKVGKTLEHRLVGSCLCENQSDTDYNQGESDKNSEKCNDEPSEFFGWYEI